MNAHPGQVRSPDVATTSHASIPQRGPYALLVGGASLVAVGAALLVAQNIGADERTLLALSGALMLCAGLCVIPSLGAPLVTRERWGLVVMGVSAARTLVGMGAMLVLIEGLGLENRPVVMSLLTGVGIMMIVEAAVAVWLLAKYPPTAVKLRGTDEHAGGKTA